MRWPMALAHLSLIAGACGTDQGSTFTPNPCIEEPDPTGTLSVDGGTWRFTDVGRSAGIQDWWGTQKGAGFADVDGDGDLDLMLGNVNTPSQLLINQLADTGELSFLPHADPPTVEIPWGIAFADYDNDGDADLFLACGGFYGACTDGLFRNDGVDPASGEVLYTDVTADSGLGDKAYNSMHGAWVDQDRDGLLDLYVSVRVPNVMFDEDPDPTISTSNRLFRNMGDDKFVDVAPDLGIDDPGDSGSAAWFDANGDAWLDLFVPTLMGDNTLYLSQGGTSYVASSAEFPRPLLAFGAASTDVDGDGDMDLVVDEYHQDWVLEQGLPAQGHAIYLNDGDGGFTESSDETGLTSLIGGGMGTMGFQVADLDLDGDPEVFFGAGGPYVNGGEENRLVSSVVSASGEQHWEDRSAPFDLAAVAACGEAIPESRYPYRTHASVVLDIDGDQDLDLFVGNGGVLWENFESYPYDPNRLWINESDLPNAAIWVELEGTQSNLDGVGAFVIITDESDDSATPWMRREMMRCTRGFAASMPPVLAMGVGTRQGPFTIHVTWPSGEETEVTGLLPGAALTIEEMTNE
jgi:hypothetical protein